MSKPKFFIFCHVTLRFVTKVELYPATFAESFSLIRHPFKDLVFVFDTAFEECGQMWFCGRLTFRLSKLGNYQCHQNRPSWPGLALIWALCTKSHNLCLWDEHRKLVFDKSYVHLKKSEKKSGFFFDIFLDFFLDFFLDIFLDIFFHFYYIKKSGLFFGYFCPEKKNLKKNPDFFME